MKNTKRINDILVELFEAVLKEEERALKEANRNDLSITETHTLVAIGERGSTAMTNIAKKLKISVSTLTTAINKLEKKGLVEKNKSTKDKRIVNIALTEEGARIVNVHANFHEKMVENAVANLSEEEIDGFEKSIEKISAYFNR